MSTQSKSFAWAPASGCASLSARRRVTASRSAASSSQSAGCPLTKRAPRSAWPPMATSSPTSIPISRAPARRPAPQPLSSAVLVTAPHRRAQPGRGRDAGRPALPA